MRQEEIEQCPDLQQLFDELHEAEPYSIHTKSRFGLVYTTTIQTAAGDTVIYRSTPKITYTVVDVGTAGSADVYSSFEIKGTVSVNGDLNNDWQNAIRYKNIEGKMGCGVNTAFTNDVSLAGNSPSSLSLDIKGIIGFGFNAKGCTTAKEIMDAFSLIQYTPGRVSKRDITTPNVKSVAAKMDTGELYDNKHNLTVQSSISTENSTTPANQSAIAVAEWTYDVHFGGSLTPRYSGVKLYVDVGYVVNVK